ncbi:MAG: betaine/proline/choline family ABC transporter ATP-binding protein [Syntrophomonadaceae bacterium]|nr:betaine/proline/choline family ABC transporter ATP-binding protein [Syntrophomonadaceae bacterium]MDD3271195.1 betaine/proline/choline family ABC transporter ATP-binding protein [Syntrophomonadaceae bacterium]MDD3898078.1 betaine/proline/choline family ABC transporter ATP-binding protein [Syntrophomonadaceae bacterium]
MESSTYLLEVENLWKVFVEKDSTLHMEDYLSGSGDVNGQVVAVRDVSFKLKQGEVYVIMGLSGSGKSTLIRCLSRLIEPDYGQVRVKGQDVTAMGLKQLTEFRRTQAAMVFQHYGLLPHRTVLENVAFGLKLQGVKPREREKRALQVLEKVGLLKWTHHYPEHLSGGMQQRVGIARALVQDADLLLLDEPFSGLDPLIRREMQDELLRLQAELHKTMVFVTHDLKEALRLGDRMAVMKQGIFVQEGTPRDIVMNPADEYVQRFVQNERQVSLLTETAEGKNKVANLTPLVGGKKAKLAAGSRR